MANHRIYQYTSIGRPLDRAWPTNRAVLFLLPAAALLGAFTSGDYSPLPMLQRAAVFALVLFASWALARELNPDDQAAAFIGMGVGLAVALLVDSPGLLVAFTTLGLVRLVNRSTGLAARKADSIVLLLLTIAVIYRSGSPLFGIAAALAFVLDGTLAKPLRRQWLFALLCFGASVVYVVDHDAGLDHLYAPDSLFEWLSLLFLLILALDTVLLRRVQSHGDVGGQPLDVNRVRGGMAVGLLAALQGVDRPESVAVIVAAIAGIDISIALRKGFQAPTAAGPPLSGPRE